MSNKKQLHSKRKGRWRGRKQRRIRKRKGEEQERVAEEEKERSGRRERLKGGRRKRKCKSKKKGKRIPIDSQDVCWITAVRRVKEISSQFPSLNNKDCVCVCFR